MKRESKFILGLNTAKNNDYIEKCFKQKLYGIKFSTGKSVGANVYLRQEWNWGTAKICVFEILLRSEMRKFTLGLNAAKITSITKKYFK